MIHLVGTPVRVPSFDMDEIRGIEGSAFELGGLFGSPGLGDGIVEGSCGVKTSNGQVETGVSVGIMSSQADAVALNEEDEQGENKYLSVHLNLI